jgi:hypothetical protein
MAFAVVSSSQFEVSLGYTASRGGASSWPNSRENTILKTTAAGARPAQHYGYNTNLLSMMLICEIALNDLCKDHPRSDKQIDTSDSKRISVIRLLIPALLRLLSPSRSCYVHQDEDAITTRYLLRF